MSHVDSTVVDEVLEILEGEFGKLDILIVTTEKFHNNLGMKIDNYNKGNVMIPMINYIYIFAYFSILIIRVETTIATKHHIEVKK